MWLVGDSNTSIVCNETLSEEIGRIIGYSSFHLSSQYITLPSLFKPVNLFTGCHVAPRVMALHVSYVHVTLI